MSLLRDCEFLNAAREQGRPMVDRHIGLRVTKEIKISKRRGHPCGTGTNQKYERCSSCGGMVILPCLACSLERWISV